MSQKTPMWRAMAVIGVASLVLAACAEDDDEVVVDPDEDVEEDEPDPAVALDFEGTLNVGVILPQSGQLEFLSPPMFAGIDVALAEINEAGGVWGNSVEITITDEGDPETPDVAVANADTLIREGVNAVIGAAATGITLNIIEALRDAEIVQVSPSNTGIVLDENPARDYYLRTSPSDVVQGTVLAEEIIADGYASLAILARQDAYGEGLAAQTRDVYEAAGGEVVEYVIYDPGAAEFSAEVAAIRDADPDAIALITFEEGPGLIFPALAEGGLGIEDGKQWYLVDGNLATYDETSDTPFPEGFLAGVKGTAPTSEEEPEDFYARMDEEDAALTTYTYGPEAYDALVLIALGATAANGDDAGAIKQAMIDVSRDPGTTCTGFAACLELLQAGEEINYGGPSGPINFNDVGDLSQSVIGIYVYDDENQFSLERTETGQL